MIKIITTYGQLLLIAMGRTLLLAFLGLIFACILGMIFGLLSVVKNKACNIIAQIFVFVIRGVPMIVLAFYVFFGIPYLLNTILGIGNGFTLSALQAGVICLALNCGAYMAEIIRAGIQSIDQGQTEAARSLGLSQTMNLRYIILPQALKNILPAIANEFVVIIKESAITYTIGVQDIMSAVNAVKGATFIIIEPLLVATAIYFCLCFPTSKLIAYFERRMSHGDKR